MPQPVMMPPRAVRSVISARLEYVDPDECSRSMVPDDATGIGRHRQPGPLDLAMAGLAAELGGQLDHLGDARWPRAGGPGPPGRRWG